jgi:hypothetical protein
MQSLPFADEAGSLLAPRWSSMTRNVQDRPQEDFEFSRLVPPIVWLVALCAVTVALWRPW